MKRLGFTFCDGAAIRKNERPDLVDSRQVASFFLRFLIVLEDIEEKERRAAAHSAAIAGRGAGRGKGGGPAAYSKQSTGRE